MDLASLELTSKNLEVPIREGTVTMPRGQMDSASQDLEALLESGMTTRRRGGQTSPPSPELIPKDMEA